MGIIKYYTCGSMSEKEGMTIAINEYDEEGNLLNGNPLKSLYKAKEITQEQYNDYLKKMNNPDSLIGLAGGLINEKGQQAIKDFFIAMEKEKKQQGIEKNEAQIALSVKKIKKLLALEIIEQGDVDTEIEQQGMKEFKDEIKKRLEQ